MVLTQNSIYSNSDWSFYRCNVFVAVSLSRWFFTLLNVPTHIGYFCFGQIVIVPKAFARIDMIPYGWFACSAKITKVTLKLFATFGRQMEAHRTQGVVHTSALTKIFRVVICIGDGCVLWSYRLNTIHYRRMIFCIFRLMECSDDDDDDDRWQSDFHDSRGQEVNWTEKKEKERKKFIWISLMSEELAKNMQLMKLWLSVSFLSWMIFSDKTDRLAC